jgi:hypothetical protein
MSLDGERPAGLADPNVAEWPKEPAAGSFSVFAFGIRLVLRCQAHGFRSRAGPTDAGWIHEPACTGKAARAGPFCLHLPSARRATGVTSFTGMAEFELHSGVDQLAAARG